MIDLLLINPDRCKKNIFQILILKKSRAQHFQLGSSARTLASIPDRVSVTFHLAGVYIIFSSVWVAEWPPFGK